MEICLFYLKDEAEFSFPSLMMPGDYISSYLFDTEPLILLGSP